VWLRQDWQRAFAYIVHPRRFRTQASLQTLPVGLLLAQKQKADRFAVGFAPSSPAVVYFRFYPTSTISIIDPRRNMSRPLQNCTSAGLS
jgi:hypothetical protein